MIILMSGGTGFIGSRLASSLAALGHEVRILTRSPRSSENSLRYFLWDGSADAKIASEALSGVEAVVHLAGESLAKGRWSNRRKKQLYDSRVLATKNLISQIKDINSLKVFVSTSAVGVYGYSENSALDESSRKGEGFIAELCGEWEAAVETLSKQRPDIRRIILRLGVVIGAGGGFLAEVLPVFRRGFGAVLGNGRQWLSWISLKDLIRLFEKLLFEPAYEGVYNATSASPVTNQQMSLELASQLKVRLLPSVPGFVLMVLYGEMSEMLLKGAPVVSRRLNDAGFSFSIPDFKAALVEALSEYRSTSNDVKTH